MDLALGLAAKIEWRVVAWLNLTGRRIIRSDIAGHATLATFDELDGRHELRRLVAIACGINDAQRRAVTTGERLPVHVHGEQNTRGKQILDGEILVPFVGALHAHSLRGLTRFRRFQQMAEAEPAPIRPGRPTLHAPEPRI